jgi:hypothetical protein
LLNTALKKYLWKIHCVFNPYDLNLAYVFVKAVRPLNRKFESEEDYLKNEKIIEEQKNTRE